MAEILVRDEAVTVRLTLLEKLGAFHGDIRVPIANIESARIVARPWSELRGLRAPGTGIPGIITLGTRRGRFGRDFAAVYQQRPAVVLELRDEPFSRLIVSTRDPEAVLASVARH